MQKRKNISVDQCERSTPSRNRPTAVVLRKATDAPERTYSRKPRCELSSREATQMRIYMILQQTYPKAGLKAKLNSTTMVTFVLHIPPIKAIQSISKSEPI